VITGSIKANFPARISFKVSSMVDSKTILDGRGAEQLVGQGDMLISTGNDVVRVQCAYVDTAEVDRVSHFVSQQQSYAEVFALPEVDEDSGDFSGKSVDKTKLDEMFYLAAKEVILSQNGSSSWLQRKFEIGFNRAAKIMDQLEAVGVVGPVKGSKPREVYIQFIEELDMLLNAIK
jgi:S-DNA-T family DNA segregation ATPase FtsK/SpoIIIE